MQTREGKPGKVRTRSIIVLVVSVIGLIIGADLFIGAILGLVGGILGLTWKSPAQPATQPTAQTSASQKQ